MKKPMIADSNTANVPTKIKKSLPALIRKHILKKKQGFDILWIAGVLNMEAKLMEEIFENSSGRVTGSNQNLGNKYVSAGVNIWSNKYYKERNGKQKLNMALEAKKEILDNI